jgi:hypothetical protein
MLAKIFGSNVAACAIPVLNNDDVREGAGLEIVTPSFGNKRL